MTSGGSEITTGELARMIQSMDQNHREDLQGISTRLDSFVRRDVYTVEQAGMGTRVTGVEAGLKALEARRELDETKRQTFNRWMISSLLIPGVGLVIAVITLLQQRGK